MDDKFYEVSVDEQYLNMRCDVFISNIAAVTRAKAQKMIEAKLVTINGKPCKNNLKLSLGDVVVYRLLPPETTEIAPQDIPLQIVYEDKYLAVVNKPKGMVVHPAAGNKDGTMVNAILAKLSDLSTVGGNIRPGIVHRIDKNTSGLLIVAKTDEAHLSLAQQIAEHSFEREYRAVIIGTPKEMQGTVCAPIGRSAKDRKKMCVTEHNSKHAITHYEVLRSYGAYSYMKFRLETGRTHQIRVHCAHIGHPVLGDDVYGGVRKDFSELNGQCLHAATIGFVHPVTNEKMYFTSELPEYFKELLNKLENKYSE